MSTFDEREKAFEEQFKHDEELRFKVHARRNKLLGLWAAEKMGVKGPAAEAYAQTVVETGVAKPSRDDVLQKVVKDLAGKGISIGLAEVTHEMERLRPIAKAQVEKA